MQYALIKADSVENVVEADQEFIDSIADQWDHIEPLDTLHEQGLGVGIGWTYEGGEFTPPPAPAPEQPPVYEWYIDIGPFFDRFGAAKMAVLTSSDVGVQALLKDIQIRKWIDLKNAEVAHGLAYIGTKVSAVTPELQQAVLTTPVTSEENLALRRLYFRS